MMLLVGILRFIVGQESDTSSADFLDEHPGGAHIILRCSGRDATAEYESVHSPELVEETLPPTSFKGVVDPDSIPKSQEKIISRQEHERKSRFPPLSSMINVNDFESVAKQYLNPTGWAYYSSGADDEYSKHDAARAYRKLALRPRILRSVDLIDTRTTILGKSSSLPVYVSPSGLGKVRVLISHCVAFCPQFCRACRLVETDLEMIPVCTSGCRMRLRRRSREGRPDPSHPHKPEYVD